MLQRVIGLELVFPHGHTVHVTARDYGRQAKLCNARNVLSLKNTIGCNCDKARLKQCTVTVYFAFICGMKVNGFMFLEPYRNLKSIHV
jgi:hypothetical protein